MLPEYISTALHKVGTLLLIDLEVVAIPIRTTWIVKGRQPAYTAKYFETMKSTCVLEQLTN